MERFEATPRRSRSCEPSSTRAMAFMSVDEVAEFAALMRLVVDHRGVLDFRWVAALFRVSASVVNTIEARAAHVVGTPPRWRLRCS